MNDHKRILEEHRQLLISRSYTSQELSNPDRKDHLLKDLERQFSKAYTSSSIEDEPTAFNLQVIGFFDNDKRTLKFEFHYLYDPPKQELIITQLDISEGKAKRSVLLASSYDLPTTNKAPALMDEYRLWMVRRQSNYTPVHESKQNQQRKKR